MAALSVTDFVKEVKSGSISVHEHTAQILEEAEKTNPEYNHFALIAKESALKDAAELDNLVRSGKASGKLLGVPVSVKDCICVKGMESRSSSRILSGYIPPFDATAIAKVRKEGAIIIGKTNQDEFGFGTFGNNAGLGFGLPRNPLDEKRSCGGSSAGSAGFTALTKHTHLSIGESTGGSIAAPSSFCGVASITPTYGRVSRYGLMDYASSMDKIGTMAKGVSDASLLLNVISGFDEKDSTSLKEESPREIPKKFKLGIPKDLLETVDEKIMKEFWRFVEKAEESGFECEEISLPLNTKYGISVYYLIAVSEASTNLAKYCGMRYGASGELKGTFDEYFSKVRSTHLGREAKRRIILGTFARMSGFRDAYYLKAMKARTLLIGEYKRMFSKLDAIVHPTMPVTAPLFSEIEKLTPAQIYGMDLCTCPANLAGLPHISINFSKIDSLPAGLMLTGNHLDEHKLVSAAEKLEALVA